MLGVKGASSNKMVVEHPKQPVEAEKYTLGNLEDKVDSVYYYAALKMSCLSSAVHHLLDTAI